jgi:hypothetical protein
VLGIVPAEDVGVELTQVHGDDVEVLVFEAGDDLAHQFALHGIRLEQDQGAIRHGRPRYRRSIGAQLAR